LDCVEDSKLIIQPIQKTGGFPCTRARPRLYNLLAFRNSVDTVLTVVDILAGNLAQIRLILGSNNVIETSAGSYPLETPSAQQSGLKINL